MAYWVEALYGDSYDKELEKIPDQIKESRLQLTITTGTFLQALVTKAYIDTIGNLQKKR